MLCMKAHLKCAKIMSKSIWLLEKGHSFWPNIFYASTEKKDQEVGCISCEVNFESRNVEWSLNLNFTRHLESCRFSTWMSHPDGPLLKILMLYTAISYITCTWSVISVIWIQCYDRWCRRSTVRNHPRTLMISPIFGIHFCLAC